MAYCEADELLVGQMLTRLPPQVVPDDLIEAASSEIDAKLGFTYVTPFVLSGEGALPQHQAKLIKDICVKLASGRIILAATSTMEQSTVHQYGASLVRDAIVSLTAIANGDVNLAVPMVDSEGNPRKAAPNPEESDPFAYVPTGTSRDTEGGVEAFEREFMRPKSGYRSTPYVDPYQPGANV